MSGFANSFFNALGQLLKQAIRSPNYVAGTSGWSINKDGSVEFNNGVFRGTVTAGTFQGTDFVINSSGAFFYSGTPAAGNLIVAIAPGPGHDTYGNSYGTGLSIFNTLGAIELDLQDGVIEWHHSQYLFDAVIEAFTAGTTADTPALSISSPTNDNTGLTHPAALIMLQGGSATGVAPWIQLSGQDANAGGLQRITAQMIGRLAGTNPSATPGTTPSTAGIETWHNPSYNANWLTSTTFNGLTGLQGLRYRLDAEDNVWIQGAFKAGGTLPGAAVFGLPAGWMPAVVQMIPCYRNNAGAVTAGLALVNAAGNVDLFAGGNMTVAINNEYYINGKIALGNI